MCACVCVSIVALTVHDWPACPVSSDLFSPLLAGGCFTNRFLVSHLSILFHLIKVRERSASCNTMEAGEEEDERGNAVQVESEEKQVEEEAGQDPTVVQLQSEVKELRGQLAELELEKEALMKKTRSLEDRQVKNWKWIQEATKFSGSFSLLFLLFCY